MKMPITASACLADILHGHGREIFGRTTRAGILAALREIKGASAPAWSKAKKKELAAIADREAANSGWLPKILRQAEETTPS